MTQHRLTMTPKRLVLVVGLAVLASIAASHFSPSAFMSIEAMLESGYFNDPDYPGTIRGDSCGDCDDGVIRFNDSIALINIMSDEESDVREEAGFAFRYLQRHLLRQFNDYEGEEATDYALKMLKHLVSKAPEDRDLAVVYYQLYLTADEQLNSFELKAEEIAEARSLFSSFCSRRWGEKLTLKRASNGDLSLVSESPPKSTPTKADWALHVNTITRRNQRRELEVIPRHCFKSKDSIYQLLDYEKSFDSAVYLQNKPLAIELAYLKPELLEDLKDYPGKYRSYKSRPNSEDRLLTSYEWVVKWLTHESSAERRSSKSLLENFDFEQGDAHWRFSGNSRWASEIGSMQSVGVKIAAKSDKISYVSQCVPLDGHQHYKLSVDVKSTYIEDDKNSIYAGPDHAYLSWHNSLDCTGSSERAEQIRPEPGGRWQRIEGYLRTPTLDAVAASVSLVQNRPGSIAYWDNVKLYGVGKKYSPDRVTGANNLKALPPSHNVIQNGTFSQGLTAWHNPTTGLWKKSLDQFSSMGHSTHIEHQGALRVEVATNSWFFGEEVLSQCVTLGSQRFYQLSAFAQKDITSDQPGRGFLTVTWFADSECKGQYKRASSLEVKDSTEWHKLVVIQEAPSQATTAFVRVFQQVDGPGRFIVNWDDIELRVAKKQKDNIEPGMTFDVFYRSYLAPANGHLF